MFVQQIVNSVFTSNSYILSKESVTDIWLVDIGDIQPLLNKMPKGGKVKGVFLTHTHYDHIYGINKLMNLFPDCVAYTSVAGKDGLFSDRLNLSRYHDDLIIFSGENLVVLKEGDELEIFPKETIRVMETPGHDLSCLVYYTENSVFTGDSYIPGLKVITSFPKSNKENASLSEKRIIPMCKNKNVYPGHGVWYADFISNFI